MSFKQFLFQFYTGFYNRLFRRLGQFIDATLHPPQPMQWPPRPRVDRRRVQIIGGHEWRRAGDSDPEILA